MPTRTPGAVHELAQEIAKESGLDDKSFLGLTVISWIDLAVSATSGKVIFVCD